MKLVVQYLGYLFWISAFFRIIPIGVGWYYAEDISSFLFTAFLSLIIGLILVWASRRMRVGSDELTLEKGFILVALSFVFIPIVGCISFLPYLDFNFLDAYFESISGFTTTGLSLYDSLDELPKSILIWRSEIQWMGGIGIIMFFLFLFTRVNNSDESHLAEAEYKTKSKMALYRAQGFSEKLEGGLGRTVSRALMIYFAYTLCGILFLFLSGMSFFEAMGMSFAAISTGGFSVSNTFYNNNLQLFILSVLMILGSISFIAHNKLFKGQWKKFALIYEKNVFFIFLIITIGVALTVYSDVSVVVFQMISAFTTTGYATTDIALLPPLFVFMMIMAMMIGGSAASTSGGIKVFRVYHLLRAVPWYIKKLASPSGAILPLKIHDRSVEDGEITSVAIFIFTYIFFAVFGTIVFMIFGESFLDSVFQVVSALSTVGLQTMDLNSLHFIQKIVLMFAMILGRLEIFPLLIVIRKIFTNKNLFN